MDTDRLVRSPTVSCRENSPHELPVGRTSMKLEIAPSVPDKTALGIGAVETEEDQRLLHHLLGLERDCELRILVRNVFWGVGRPRGIGGCGEDDRGLGFLTLVRWKV